MWNRVIGQTRVKGLLRSAIEGGRVAHAYLFYGEEGAGMDALAIEFGRALNCERGGSEACDRCASCKQFEKLQHPNLKLVVALPRGKSEKSDDSPIDALTEEEVRLVQKQFQLKAENLYHQIRIPRANEIRINSIRELRRDATLSPFAMGWKVFILFDAERMNDESSNALLKTLEEPTPRTVLILTTSKREKLLPTILSRCQQLKLDPLSSKEICAALNTHHGVPLEQAQLVATLANGNFTRALDLLNEDVRARRDSVVNFVRNALGDRSLRLFDQVEQLTAEFDRFHIEQWLALMLVWLRDAACLREGDRTGLVNIDERESLERFITRFPSADLSEAMEKVEEAIALVGKNVYLPLVLANLAFQLKDAITVAPKETIDQNKPT
jgi:DNA polymerase-3 subunit delta'